MGPSPSQKGTRFEVLDPYTADMAIMAIRHVSRAARPGSLRWRGAAATAYAATAYANTHNCAYCLYAQPGRVRNARATYSARRDACSYQY